MSASARLALPLALLLLLVPSRSSAQPAAYGSDSVADTASEEALLDSWLTLHASRAETARLASGISAMGLGLLEIPIESVILATQPQHPSDSTTLVFASVGITFGVLDLAYGLYKLLSPSVQEERLSRWRSLRAAGAVSPRDLGRFEGEVRGELASIQDGRRMWLAVGVGLLAAGAVGAGLTFGYADSDLGRIVGYSCAGTAALSGALLAVVPWLDAGADSEWLRIEGGLGPQLTHLAPWMTPYGVGVSAGGTL